MTYPELFSQLDESKRAEKMLELVIPSLFRPKALPDFIESLTSHSLRC
jgi:hypothetical protein